MSLKSLRWSHDLKSKHNCGTTGPLLKLLLTVSLVLSVNAGVSGQQSSGRKALRLSKIEIVGLKRLTEEQVIATSGLQLGQAVDTETLDAASKKLIDSGLFTKLSYRLHSAGEQAIVTFHVEEAKRVLPVVFDNFVWFSDDELFNAIRRDVPFFYGTVSDSGDAADSVARALQRLLNEKRIPGHVEHLPYADLAKGTEEYIFTVKGVTIPVCAVHFPGSDAIPEEELAKNSRPLIGADYSRKDVGQFALYNLFPLYRHIGHLRAKFNEPSTTPTPEAGAECKNGATVTIQVEEGPAYRWDRAEWSGNQALTSEDLSAWLQMSSGEIADGLKIDKGLQAVKKTYSRKGYLEVHITATESFDDSAGRVVDKFSVKEGPQYHMGNLIIVGLSDEDTTRLKQRWHLPPGAVFDASYLEDFVKQALRDFFPEILPHSAGSAPKKVTGEAKPDLLTHTVDLIVTVK